MRAFPSARQIILTLIIRLRNQKYIKKPKRPPGRLTLNTFKKTYMKQFILISTLLLFVACSSDTKTTTEASTTESTNDFKSFVSDNALTFINSYVDNCNKMKESVGVVEWVNSNSLASDHFKKELEKIITEANQKDPEMGLGFDPIFDAQDYPEEGFELDSFDIEPGFIVVVGKNMPDFKLTMNMVDNNGIWLVDGCGIINIPNDKRIKR